MEYRKVNSFFVDYTRNIAKGSTVIKTAKVLPIGTQFLFKLVVPTRNEPFEILGEVAAVSSDSPDASMQIKFVFPNEEGRAKLDREVEKMMSDSLGPYLSRKLLRQLRNSTSEDSSESGTCG